MEKLIVSECNGTILLTRLFQRATLAEKEVTSLKEKLATQGGGGSSSGAAMAPPPPEREDSLISSQHELAAKDKEVISD
jgi:hypothetical protein